MIRILAILLLGIGLAQAQLPVDAFTATTNEVSDGYNQTKPVTPWGLNKRLAQHDATNTPALPTGIVTNGTYATPGASVVNIANAIDQRTTIISSQGVSLGETTSTNPYVAYANLRVSTYDGGTSYHGLLNLGDDLTFNSITLDSHLGSGVFSGGATFGGEVDQIANINGYHQHFVQNQNPLGSADFVWGNDLSSPTSSGGYGNAGINGSGHAWNVTDKWGGYGDCYVYSSWTCTNFFIGPDATNGNFIIQNRDVLGNYFTNAIFNAAQINLNTNVYVWEAYRVSTLPYDPTEFITASDVTNRIVDATNRLFATIATNFQATNQNLTTLAGGSPLTNAVNSSGPVSGYNGQFTNCVVISNSVVGCLLVMTNNGYPTLATVGGRTNIPVLWGTNAITGMLNISYVNASGTLTAAPLTIGALTLSQLASSCTVNGNLTGSSATVGSVSLTNLTGTNVLVQRVLMLGTNGLVNLSPTNSLMQTNWPFLAGTNNLFGPCFFLGYFDNSSNLQTATLILRTLSFSNLVGGAISSCTVSNLNATNATITGTLTTSNLVGAANGLTNIPAAGLLRAISTWGGPTNNVAVTNVSDLLYVTTTNCSITNVFGGAAGYVSPVTLTISNSTAGAITSYWSAAGYAVGAATTNILTIPAGKEGYYTIWIRNGNRTNYMSCLQQ